MGRLVKLKNVRICYAQNLFTPTAAEEGKPKKFSSQFVIMNNDTAQLKAIRDAIDAVAEEKWPKKGATVVKSLIGTDFLCLRNGDQKPDRSELEDAHYIDAKNKIRPTVLNKDKSQLTEDDGVIYSGCYVNANLDIYAHEYTEGKIRKSMVLAELQGVQFVKDGDAFSGSSKVSDADEFDDISDTGTDDGSDLV